MRLRVQTVGQGDHPHGLIVELITTTGPDRLLVEDTEVEGNSVKVGYPLRSDNDLVWIALPRPTLNGCFRVWVRAADILPNTVFA